MNVRRIVVPVVAVSLLLAACRRDPPPEPEPQGPTQAQLDSIRADSIRRAREDSIRRAQQLAAEEARQLEEARRRARELLTQMVFFDYDESRITSAAEATLREKVEILRANPQVQLRLEGHADERGSTEYNLALGNRRAQAVMDFLTGFGLEASRFTTVSYGEERPLVNQSNESAWARNRRVEFVITAGGDQINPPGVGG